MSLFNNDISTYRDNLIINEAYIGKTDTLKQIESKFNELRSKELNYYSNISQNSKIIEINRLFEKQFGMDIFALKIIPTKSYDAYTMVIANNFDIANNVDLPMMVTGTMSEGFRWKPNNGFCIIVNVSYGIVADKKFTDAEIVSIILHEIGHNFADALYNNINFMNKDIMKEYEKYLISYATLLGFLKSIPNYIKAKKMLRDYNNSTKAENERKGKNSGKLHGLIEALKGKHKDYKSYKNEIRARKTGGKRIKHQKRYAGQAQKDMSRESLYRQNEVIADKFAGIYGYGVEISSSLTKMNYTKSDAQKKLESAGGRLAAASREYDNQVRDITDYDEHPQLVQRIMEELKLLEREIQKDDIDPKVKEVINGQINDLKELLNKITSTSDKLSRDENAQNAYNDYIRQNAPGAVSDEIEEKIEEALDKLLEEDKKKNRK